EPAGAGETEATLRVLSRARADALREELLVGRRAAAGRAGGVPAAAAQEPVHELARLSTRDLIIAGATASEAGIVAAAVGGALQFADDLPLIDVPDFLPEPESIVQASESMLLFAVVGLIIAVLLIGWVFSILGAVVTYHGFTLEQS